MANPFFERPILNSPYEYLARYWELDEQGQPTQHVLDPYNPTGSTAHVNFNTSKTDRWETDARRCHLNWVTLDSDWEAEFCRVVESHPNWWLPPAA